MLHLQVPPVVLINAAPASTTVAGHDSYYTLHTGKQGYVAIIYLK